MTGSHAKRLIQRVILAETALVVVLSVAAIAAGQARAAFPGADGKLVFETNRDGNEEIYTMDSDGTNRVDLTRNPADDTDPRWSADGSRIVFASNRSGNFQLYTMNADGSGVMRVTHDGNDDRRPTWTADGRILFQTGSFPNRVLCSIGADGNGLQQLTPVSSDNATVSHPDVKVACDNFRVNSGTFSCPSWWTDIAPNWQPLP